MEEQRPKTLTELKAQRKEEMKNFGGQFLNKYISQHPHMIEIPFEVQPPHPQSLAQYIQHPKIQTKSELDLKRHQEVLLANEKSKDFNHKTPEERVKEREILMITKPTAGIKRKIDELRSKDLEIWKEKFSKRPIGLHGEELPKFSEHAKDYWRHKQGYVEKPETKNKEFQQSRPISEFCRLRIKHSAANGEITLKPGEINPFPGFTPSDCEMANIRGGPRSRFIDEMMTCSRPSSEMPTFDSGVKKNRPMTAFEKPKTSVRKVRPFTANAEIKTSGTERCLIRSRGFY